MAGMYSLVTVTLITGAINERGDTSLTRKQLCAPVQFVCMRSNRVSNNTS